MTTLNPAEMVSYEQFQEEWLADIQDAGLSPLDKGRRFAAKLVTQWLNVTTDDDDFIICDGSGDGGIDIAYFQRADADVGDLDEFEDGDTWYIVQSKYGTSFMGEKSIRDEGHKVIDTLQGQNPNLSHDTEQVLAKIGAFREQKSDNNRIVLVFATLDPILEQDRQALDYVKRIGRSQVSDNFDVEEVSLRTIWESVIEESDEVMSLPISGQFVDRYAGLLVGMVSLIDLFKFLVAYKQKAGSLDQLYEKNVRQFLGSKKKVNKGMVTTLNENPHLFGLYNNGITFVVSDYSREPNGNVVTVNDPYVVNGCQTTRTIWDVLDRKLQPDGSSRSPAINPWKENVEQGSVVAKIVKSGESGIMDITRFTNSQNAVSARDFLALEEGFKDWSSGMSNRHRIYLERQSGGIAVQKAWEKQHPEEQKFKDYVSAFELIKVYGAGWLSAPGTALSKNAPFLPKGTFYQRMMARPDGEESFGVSDLFAAYKIKCEAERIGFGANAAFATRSQSKFLFYYVVMEMLRDVMRRPPLGIMVSESSLTEAVIKLATPQAETELHSLCDAAADVIDEYLTQGSDDSVFNEPSFGINLATFLKSDQLGRSDTYAPSLRQLVGNHNRIFGVKVGPTSRRETVTKTLAG